MPQRGDRRGLRAIAQATFLLVAVAIGGHVVWLLLAPMLPTLLVIFFVMLVAYLLLGRRF